MDPLSAFIRKFSARRVIVSQRRTRESFVVFGARRNSAKASPSKSVSPQLPLWALRKTKQFVLGIEEQSFRPRAHGCDRPRCILQRSLPLPVHLDIPRRTTTCTSGARAPSRGLQVSR